MNEHVLTAEATHPREDLPTQQRREEARRMYRESVAAELPMTARALGEAFGRSARWGRDRIAEVRGEDDVEQEADQQRQSGGMPRTDESESGGNDGSHIDTAGMPGPVRQPSGMPPAEVGMPRQRSGMPRRPVRSWPVLLLALPAFVAIWGGWVGLGEMTGFGEINLLPGIVADGGWATINSAITLPIGVETYAAYALRAWLSGAAVSPRARRFAKWSAVGSLSLGFLGQVAYHQMAADGVTTAPWLITTMVSGLPVAVLGMGAALAHLVHSDHEQDR